MQSRDIAQTIRNLFIRFRCQNYIMADGGGGYDNFFINDPNMALAIPVSVSCHNHGFSQTKSELFNAEWIQHYYRKVHILITSRYNLFVCVDPEFSGETFVPFDKWTNPTNHNSAWVDEIDSILTELTFQANDYCFGFMPSEHMKNHDRDYGVKVTLSNRIFDFFA